MFHCRCNNYFILLILFRTSLSFLALVVWFDTVSVGAWTLKTKTWLRPIFSLTDRAHTFKQFNLAFIHSSGKKHTKTWAPSVRFGKTWPNRCVSPICGGVARFPLRPIHTYNINSCFTYHRTYFIYFSFILPLTFKLVKCLYVDQLSLARGWSREWLRTTLVPLWIQFKQLWSTTLSKHHSVEAPLSRLGTPLTTHP